ncbi:DNA/RNA non-specific endonuclease [Paucibacter sp. B2R-40]|uniref:DNA/RNA non-specific endonuclease n=1 Tax=Paucibacter sp. B2R-40 TaxID=2893554 RepID=UPI0021E39984|nr:DNA/RNA non-specific endonuclease [Paucibacter sp. B2R-40]MCV2354025.1 DNA/RNA non-specific endonuclease [Paucibacter sp. B2R-40]
MALYSAANVDFGGRYDMRRPPDVWRLDPRIAADAQLTSFYYANNQFDRGHLTRREDMEYGATRMQALVSAADTCHWTNCTPQHAQFNQNKQLWQGIERHLLEGAVELQSFRAQVITGPIFDAGDPSWSKYPEIQYPVKFWKVVAALTDAGRLFATANILDQSAVIEKLGIEKAREVPFGVFKTFQVPISEVERLTQLTFNGGPLKKPFSLTTVDPLASAILNMPKKPGGRSTRALGVDSSPAWRQLDALESMTVPS